MGTSRLHELHESKFPLVSRIEFVGSKLSNSSAHVSGVADSGRTGGAANIATACHLSLPASTCHFLMIEIAGRDTHTV